MLLDNKKIVVVGGAGLIGSHTIDKLLLENVREIIVYDNMTRGSHENLIEAYKDPRVKFNNLGGDILQTDILNSAFKNADGVYHFAALWLLQCHDYPRSAFDVNIRGTFNVMEACVAQGVERLVYSSSASVYGDAEYEPMNESHPFNNKNFYGATKIAGEAMLRSFYHRYNLNFVGLRYMNVYGPRQDYHGAYIAVIMKMLDAIDNDENPTILGDGSEAFDFVAAEDCGYANVCAMKADTIDQFYNVGTGKRTSLKELAELIIDITKTSHSINYATRSQKTLVRNRIGCPKKASKEINFDSKIDLRSGLKKLIEWRMNHKNQLLSRQKKMEIN